MPKPILTDDIVEKARRDREQLEKNIRHGIEKDEQLAAKYDAEEARLQKQAVYKSRRIENAKTKQRGKKLDRFLIISIFILLALIFWILSPWS